MGDDTKRLLERIAVALEGIHQAPPGEGADGGLAEQVFDLGLRIREGTGEPTLVEAILKDD